MKKALLLALGFVLMTTLGFAQDKIMVQIRFNRYFYECPDDNYSFITDDNKKTYTCPLNGRKLGEGQYRDVGDTIYLTQEEYAIIKQKDLDAKIQERIDKNIYNIKNPPIYIEPTKEELENQKTDLQRQIDELQLRIDAKKIVIIE